MSRTKAQRLSLPVTFFVTTLFAYAAYSIDPSSPDMQLLQALCWLVILFGIWEILRSLPYLLRNWLLRRKAKNPTDSHGSARWAKDKDLKQSGLFHTKGVFLGLSALSGRPLFAEFTHGLTLAMAGSGKTVCFVICAILHWPSSLVVTDPKGTLTCITKWAREKIFKQKTYVLNPGRRYETLIGKSARYNPLSFIHKKMTEGRYGDMVALSKGLAYQLLPEPRNSGENTFFRLGSRSLLVFLFLYVLFLSEEKNFTKVCSLLQNELDLKQALYEASASDALKGGLASRANDLLQQTDTADSRQWQSFRVGALQVMDDYSKGTDLAEISSESDFSGYDLKRQKTTLYEICSPANKESDGRYFATANWMMMREMMDAEVLGKEVLFLLEEALNFPIHTISSDLTLIREFGIKVWFVLQDLDHYAHIFGDKNLGTMLSQTDCKQIMDVQSLKTAEWLSKMLGNSTVKQTNYALGHKWDDPVLQSASEIARPLLTPDEIRQFGGMIILYKDLPPIHAFKCGYHEVHPWRKWARPNPLKGTKKFLGKIKVWLRY